MEQSKAKAYSKRLMRDLSKITLNASISKARSALLIKRGSLKAKNRAFDLFVDELDKQCCFNVLALGRKKNRYWTWSGLSVGDFNPNYNRDEEFFYGETFIHSWSIMDIDSRVRFLVGRHAIRRFFQRADLSESDPYETWAESFINEVSFLNAAWALLNALTPNMPAKKFSSIGDLSVADSIKVFIPTTRGAFLGEFNRAVLDIRTYIADQDFTEEQLSAKKNTIFLLQKLRETPYHLAGMIDQNIFGHTLPARHVDACIMLVTSELNMRAHIYASSLFLHNPELDIYNIQRELKQVYGRDNFQDQADPIEILRYINTSSDFENYFAMLNRATRRLEKDALSSETI